MNMTVAEARMWVEGHAGADLDRIKAMAGAIRLAVWGTADDLRRAFDRSRWRADDGDDDCSALEASAAALGLRIIRK